MFLFAGDPDFAVRADAQEPLRLVARHLRGRAVPVQAHLLRPPPLRTALNFRRLAVHDPTETLFQPEAVSVGRALAVQAESLGDLSIGRRFRRASAGDFSPRTAAATAASSAARYSARPGKHNAPSHCSWRIAAAVASPYFAAAADGTGFSTHRPGDFRSDWRNSVVAGLAVLSGGLRPASESQTSNSNAASACSDFALTTPSRPEIAQQRHVLIFVVGPRVPSPGCRR